MSVSSILTTGRPELSLVGSRVAVLQPHVYSLPPTQITRDRSLTVLPNIISMPASPHHQRSDASVSRYDSTCSLLGTPHSLVMTHRDPSLLNNTLLAYQVPGWAGLQNPYIPTDADVINQALKLEKLQLNIQSPVGCPDNKTPLNHHGNSSHLTDHVNSAPMDRHDNTAELDYHVNSTELDHYGDSSTLLNNHGNSALSNHDCNSTLIDQNGNTTPLVQMTVNNVTDLNLRQTWHSELLREASKISSLQSRKDSCSFHNDETDEEDTQTLSTISTETQGKEKQRREKKRKKKKSSKLNVNKIGRSKTKLKNAARSRSLQATKLTSGYHDDRDVMMVAQCTAIKVLPTPPVLPKPKVTSSPIVTGYVHTAQKQYKLMMGATVSTSTINIMCPSLKQVTPKAAESMFMIHEAKSTNVGHTQPARVIKVFCSDRQSGVLKELGTERPCAPPSTPMPELLSKYEYIPSMNDIRSQRTVKVRLEAMEKVEKIKQEKVKDEKQKYEKLALKEKDKERKKRQRLEIYALNKIMTEFENANFREFCNRNGLNTK